MDIPYVLISEFKLHREPPRQLILKLLHRVPRELLNIYLTTLGVVPIYIISMNLLYIPYIPLDLEVASKIVDVFMNYRSETLRREVIRKYFIRKEKGEIPLLNLYTLSIEAHPPAKPMLELEDRRSLVDVLSSTLTKSLHIHYNESHKLNNEVYALVEDYVRPILYDLDKIFLIRQRFREDLYQTITIFPVRPAPPFRLGMADLDRIEILDVEDPNIDRKGLLKLVIRRILEERDIKHRLISTVLKNVEHQARLIKSILNYLNTIDPRHVLRIRASLRDLSISLGLDRPCIVKEYIDILFYDPNYILKDIMLRRERKNLETSIKHEVELEEASILTEKLVYEYILPIKLRSSEKQKIITLISVLVMLIFSRWLDNNLRSNISHFNLYRRILNNTVIDDVNIQIYVKEGDKYTNAISIFDDPSHSKAIIHGNLDLKNEDRKQVEEQAKLIRTLNNATNSMILLARVGKDETLLEHVNKILQDITDKGEKNTVHIIYIEHGEVKQRLKLNLTNLVNQTFHNLVNISYRFIETIEPS